MERVYHCGTLQVLNSVDSSYTSKVIFISQVVLKGLALMRATSNC